MKSYDIIFAVIAMREVIFFSNIAEILKKEGFRIGFITFYEPSDQYLIRKGYTVYSIHNYLKNRNSFNEDLTREKIKYYEQQLGIFNMRDLILHEKLTFNRYDEDRLLKKCIQYINFFKQLFTDIDCKTVVQELGGFIAPLTLFISCIKSNIKHIFLEPAMYKGRLFFTVDRINSTIKNFDSFRPDTDDFVNKYLDTYKNSKTVVIPEKDAHHFKDMTLNKIFNKSNISKLITKIKYKYLKGKKEEYDAISNHVLRYLKMYVNRKKITLLYSDIGDSEKFIYYPFHVPLDFQLTVRSNKYLDQVSLLHNIANILPYGIHLYVKEHPAAIGAYSYNETKRLLLNNNVRLLKPSINSFDIISKCKCVVTINSKVGVEAIMQHKTVIVLGEAFYRNQGVSLDVNDIKNLGSAINQALEEKPVNSELVKHFLKKTYESSYPGELYVNDQTNLLTFASSLKKTLTDTFEL